MINAGNFAVFGVVIAVMLLYGCRPNDAVNAGSTDGKITVVATFYPLYDITRKIAGDKLNVDALIPAGVEPHDYEPSPEDIIKLSRAKGFITIGFRFSGIENKLMESYDGKITAIDSKKGITLLNAQGGDKGEIERNSGKDPHIWLSPTNMIIIAGNIRDGLKNIDPLNAGLYDENAKKIIEELKLLDSEYRKGLFGCRKSVILTNHRAFAYVARDYGFNQVGISGLEPETEPTAKEIIRIKEEAIKNNATYIFTEELVDARIAQAIAGEIGAKTIVLNPIEGTKNPNEDYFSLMRANLANLKLALGCS